MNSKNILSAILAVFLITAAGCGEAEKDALADVGAKQQAETQAESHAANFALADIDGRNQAVNPGDGKLYVLNFWATWCPPCRKEMPEMDHFAAAHAQDLVFYGINMQEDSEKVTGFMQKNDYKMHVLLDAAGKVANTYHVRAIPTTVIIDGMGTVKFRKEGMATEKELEDALARVK